MVNILVIDDDKNTRRLMKAILLSEGYDVELAENGEEALQKLDEKHIDLIIVDIMMPNMDGYEFTKIVRENNNGIPMIMVSAKQLPDDRKKGFRAGIDDYLSKPVDEEELILHIKALLRRTQIANENKLNIGEVVLDNDSLSVKKGDEEIVLPQKEFQLLFLLLSYPGKIFTRIQLMDEIWGMDSETGWETVTVHVGRLRKKFENFKEFEIVSVRGLGYKAVKKI